MRHTSKSAIAATSIALFFVCAAPPALAQDAPPRLSRDHSLTLRPTPPSRRLAERMRRVLALRMSNEVLVGEDAPPEILEAVPEGHCAVAWRDDVVELLLAGPEAQVYRAEVHVGRSREAAARAVALALEALHDVALDGPPAEERAHALQLEGPGRASWVYYEREGGLFGPQERLEARAKPLIYLGLLGGVSTERLTPLVGPRIGLGLCLDPWCLIFEGDLPVIPDTSEACDGRRIEYRATTLALRLLVRALTLDDISLAIGVGVLTRFGIARAVGVDAGALATNFGLRGDVELAWRYWGPLELVFDVGVDVHTAPARFGRENRPPPGVDCPFFERVVVEDLASVWGTLSLRVRP